MKKFLLASIPVLITIILILTFAIIFKPKLELIDYLKSLNSEKYSKLKVFDVKPLDISNYSKTDTYSINYNDLTISTPYSNLNVTSNANTFTNDNVSILINTDVITEKKYEHRFWFDVYAKSYDFTKSKRLKFNFSKVGIDINKISFVLSKYTNIFEFKKQAYSFNTNEINKLNIFSSIDTITDCILKTEFRCSISSDFKNIYSFTNNNYSRFYCR